MTVGRDTLIVRGGQMVAADVEANIDQVIEHYGRPGLCVAVLIDDLVELGGDVFVPHQKICLTTPALLEEGGIEPTLEPDETSNRYQHTLWLPNDPAGTLVSLLRSAFRGPIPKGDASREWTTEDLRGLQRPGS